MFNKIFQNLIPIPIGKKVGFEMNMYVPIFMGTCHHSAMTCPGSTVDIQANNGQ